MTVLAWDTETTGLAHMKLGREWPDQPHIVQIGWVEYGEDGTEKFSRSVIVKPDGWVCPEDAIAKHGITHERQMDEGIPEDHAVALWLVAQARARLRVSHNSAFDDKIVRVGMYRAGYDGGFIDMIQRRPGFDTCRGATKLVNLPPSPKMQAKGMHFPKAPKLEECWDVLFGETFVAHDALQDARACGRLFWHLQGLQP